MKRKLDPARRQRLLAARKRLARNLESLQFYCCSSESFPRGDAGAMFRYDREMWSGIFSYGTSCYWPEALFLREIETDVYDLAMRERKHPIFPRWKAFEQVDKRFPKLRLKLRVDKLISRARDQLPGDSELYKLVRLAVGGDMKARGSLADMVADPEKLAHALNAYGYVERVLCSALPLAVRIVRMGHPMWKEFACITGTNPPRRDLYRRIKASERVARSRAKKKLLKNVNSI